MNKSIIFSVIFLIYFSKLNSQRKLNFKEGVFHSYINDSLTSIINRKGNYQTEKSIRNNNVELFIINWEKDNVYSLTPIRNELLSKYGTLNVVIDSVNGSNYYQTSKADKVNFIFTSRLKKVGHKLDEKFYEIVSNYSIKGN